MKQLILKDLYTQKRMGYFFPIFITFMMFISLSFVVGIGNFFLIAATYAAIWLSVYSNFGVVSIDLLQKRLVTSLPVTRKNIVQAKYLAALVWWGISFLFFGFIYLIIEISTSADLGLPSWQSILLSFAALYIAISIFYPLYFAYGYQIAALITVIITMSGFFSIGYLSAFFDGLENSLTISKLIIIIISILVVTLSYIGSVRVFEKKDL
ncbi:ABC-2 transporter permease [Bacillus sp. FSL K6-3431]|uniref:ABC-2 transporter permease n=1 Tax=Bacillus sp. FSL K6-3431 TaxID=2921500 RepID=UPI0030FC8A39